MFQRGELSRDGYRRILGLLQAQSEDLARRTAEYGEALPEAREVADAAVDVATAATFVPGAARAVGRVAARGTPSLIRTSAGAMRVPGAYARTGATGPGVVLSKLGGVGRALNVGKNIIARPFRTPTAKITGAIGGEALKGRIQADIVSRLTPQEQQQRIRETTTIKISNSLNKLLQIIGFKIVRGKLTSLYLGYDFKVKIRNTMRHFMKNQNTFT